MLPVNAVLGFARPEVTLLRRVHEQHLAAPVRRLVPVQYADGHGDTGPKEQVGSQAGDCLEQVGLQNAPACSVLSAPRNRKPWGITTPSKSVSDPSGARTGGENWLPPEHKVRHISRNQAHFPVCLWLGRETVALSGGEAIPLEANTQDDTPTYFPFLKY